MAPTTLAGRGNEAWYADLTDQDPITGGHEHEIFQRPGKPSQIIKVRRAESLARLSQSKSLRVRFGNRRGAGRYKNLIREYRAYIDAAIQAERLGRAPPLAHPRGLVVTDRGLGRLQQKVRDADGNLGRTVGVLARTGALDDDVLAALNVFVRDLYEFQIVANDLKPGNIVYETRRGRGRFVLVDGFGSRTLIPIRRWSRRLNDRALDKRFALLAGRIRLAWNEAERRFECAHPLRS